MADEKKTPWAGIVIVLGAALLAMIWFFFLK